ncbi:MAG TPA: hypothetical protein PLW10_23025, partial [Myxococcota bacterium]|nr:hypothetical protein [Myxococcota bacterium]
KKEAFAKKIRIEKFIRNREYQLIKDKGGKIDLLLPEGESGVVEMEFVPAKRQRLKEAVFDLGELDFTSPSARGTRIAPKPVGKLKHVPGAKSAGKKASGGAKGAGKRGAAKAADEEAGEDGEQGDLF